LQKDQKVTFTVTFTVCAVCGIIVNKFLF